MLNFKKKLGDIIREGGGIICKVRKDSRNETKFIGMKWDILGMRQERKVTQAREPIKGHNDIAAIWWATARGRK